MTPMRENLDQLLERVAAGRLDELSPEQVAALETHLNANAAAAARLANLLPRPPAGPLARVAEPSAAQWERVWRGVEAAGSRQAARGTDAASAPQTMRGRTRRFLRLWEGIAAAAACVLFAVLWRSSQPAAEASWPIQLSQHVEVDSLEVFDDSTAFVVVPDDGSDGAVIWVLDEPGA
ncbi:MAG: hypothetical protein HRF50_07480 [Phycisphaerae bacterium]